MVNIDKDGLRKVEEGEGRLRDGLYKVTGLERGDM